MTFRLMIVFEIQIVGYQKYYLPKYTAIKDLDTILKTLEKIIKDDNEQFSDELFYKKYIYI